MGAVFGMMKAIFSLYKNAGLAGFKSAVQPSGLR